MKIKILPVLAFSLWVVGCATAPASYTPVFGEADEHHLQQKVKVVSVIKQDNIKGQYIPSNSGGMAGAQFGLVGGLLGAAVDAGVNSHRAGKAEEAAAVYHPMLEGFDSAGLVGAGLEKSFEEAGMDVTEVVSIVGSAEEFKPEDHIQDLNDEKLLVVETSYSFDPSMQMVHVLSNATMYLYVKALRNDRGRKSAIYEDRSWLVHYQTPANTVSMVQKDREAVSAKIAEVEAAYADLIEDVKGSRKKRLLSERNRKIRVLNNSLYDSIEPPIERGDWTGERLSFELDKAFSATVDALAVTPFAKLTKEEFDAQRTLVPFIPGISLPGAAPTTTLEVNVFENTDGETVTYLTMEGQKHILPKNEILKFPAVVN